MKELELKKPIIAHGETLSVLEFDEPTGKDVRELGYPYQMNRMSPSDFWRMWCRNTLCGWRKCRKALSTRCLRQT